MNTKILIAALACVSLVACGHKTSQTITCSLDDDLSFSAYAVNNSTFSDGAMTYSKGGNFFVYNLGPREFCSVSNSRELAQ